MISLASRFLTALWRGPISRNLGGAIGVQLCVLVSGTLSARLLGPEGRGYIAILTAWPSAIGQLGAVGMSLAATYFLSAGRISGNGVIALLRRPAVIQITVLTLINAAIILGYTFISGAPILLAACLSLVQLPAVLCADYGIAFLLGARRHGTMGVTRMLSPGVLAAGMVVLYLLHKRSITITAALIAGAAVFAGAVTLAVGIRAVRPIQSRRSLVVDLGVAKARKELLAFGRKGYVGYLSPVDSFRIDQLVVGFLISPRALGIYVVGAAFTNFARMVAVNIGLSSTPEVAAHATALERHRAVQRTLILACGVLTLVTIGLGLFVIVAIPVLFGNAYRSSILVAEILFVSGWLLCMKRIAVDAMRGAGEARIGTRAEIVNLTLFLIACGPLGLLLGGPGVALALVFASAGGSLVLLRKLRELGVIGRSGPSAGGLSPRPQDA
jgi:antigen flippase